MEGSAATRSRRPPSSPSFRRGRLSSADAAAALAVAATARQRHARLVAILPRLRARHAEVSTQEYVAWREPKFRKVQRDRDAFNAGEADQLIAQLLDYIGRAQQMNQTISQMNSSAPAGDHRRIPSIDLAWTNSLVLVDPATGHQIWPDASASVQAAMMVAGVVPDHPGADWHEYNKAQADRKRAEAEAVAIHNEQRARGQERRANEAERQRFAERQSARM